MTKVAGLYVQYGCGFSAQNGWVNFDSSPTLRFEKIPILGMLYTRNNQRFDKRVLFGDIVKGLPIAENSCRGAYCSHVLEHLSKNDCIEALKNTYKMLEPGGLFRLVMPDLEFLAKRYVNSNDADAASLFLREALLGVECRRNSFKQLILDRFGNSRHLWLWDYKSIERALKDAGFESIRKAQFNDSRDLMFIGVENESRWVNCLGVECKK